MIFWPLQCFYLLLGKTVAFSRILRSTLVILLLVLVAGSAQANRQNFENRQDADQILEFWKTHKAHVSMGVSGYLGAFGVSMGLNYHPRWAVEFGFGGAGHFQAYGIRIKRSLMMSSAFHPYLAAGLSRWQRTKGGAFNLGDVSPGLLAKDLMSEQDKANSRIDERLAHASLGMRYIVNQQSALKDFGVFAEGLLLFDPIDLVMVPSFSVGASFFF